MIKSFRDKETESDREAAGILVGQDPMGKQRVTSVGMDIGLYWRCLVGTA